MSDYVKISIEIPTDSEVYRRATELSDKNKDLGFSVFSNPQKLLKSCLELGLNPHIIKNIELLASKADEYRKKE